MKRGALLAGWNDPLRGPVCIPIFNQFSARSLDRRGWIIAIRWIFSLPNGTPAGIRKRAGEIGKCRLERVPCIGSWNAVIRFKRV